MKVLSLLFTCLTAFAVQAQYVIVNGPAGIAGPYEFSAASFGGDLSTGVYTADAVFVTDGSANPSQGCNALTNGAALSGKIALIDRGSCDFSEKCLHAENAGAIAAVVFNHTAGDGTFSMGGAALGDQVNIPCVMLSYEDGQTIRGELANGPVNLTIGAFKYPNEIGLNDQLILNAPNGVMPAFEAEAAGLEVVPGAAVRNLGLNEAKGVVLNATIDFAPLGGSGSQVYAETGLDDSIEPDSADLIALPEYAPDQGIGVYTIHYAIESDSLDPVGYNDAKASQFYLSQNTYCKARWDFANNHPFATNSYRRESGTEIEIMSAFHLPIGAGYLLDSLEFYVSTNADSLGIVGDNNIRVNVYNWNDANGDGDAETDELELVALTPIEFPDPSLTATWMKVPLLKFPDIEGRYVIPQDDMTFIVGLRYNGPEEVFFGVDELYDQTTFVDNLALTDADLPYFWVSNWVDDIPDVDNTFVFTDFWGSFSTSLVVNEAPLATEDVPLENATVSLFPNPANSRFSVAVDLGEMSSQLEYKIHDAAGRLLFTRQLANVQVDQSMFDATALPAGQYFLTVRTENGSLHKGFTVQH
ncbi:MAG: T9SS type A sorting domain-containing protein [Lewinellaceae bacterium]|nr:T9SS type A sorting domain-containing protein [Saprospiraceae bacterium]MCB9341235.1 T9SS type A sorting domain-containing protein [Lewinellaceae bacterium]